MIFIVIMISITIIVIIIIIIAIIINSIKDDIWDTNELFHMLKLIYSTFITLIVITISITIIIIITIIITISIITSKLTNFREQSLMPCKQKKKKVLSLFTLPCISY